MPVSITRNPTSDFATGGTVAYSSGTTGWNLVNDYADTADPLTSYVTLGTTANSFIVFNFSAFDVPANSSIVSLQIVYTDEEPSNGANTAAARIRVGGVYYDASTHNPSTTTTIRGDTWTTNPATSAKWTIEDINGTGANPLQNFGVIGPDSNPVWRLGSIQANVTYVPPANPGLGQLVITGLAPTITVSTSTTVSPSVGALTLTGLVPAVSVPATSIAPSVGALVIGGLAPSVSVPAASISPSIGQLVIGGQAPSISVPATSVSADVGSLVFNGLVPSITVSQAGSIQPALGELIITGLAPTISVPAVTISPSTGSLVLEGKAPTLPAGTELIRVTWACLELPQAVAAVAARQQPAGKSKRRRYRKPIIVEIDGETFVVNYEEEAEALLVAARELAERKAKEEAERIVFKRRNKSKVKKKPLDGSPVWIDAPKVSASDTKAAQALADKIRAEFDAIYAAAARDAEIAILEQIHRAVDEDEAIAVLLMAI